jgi:hypothetical protein
VTAAEGETFLLMDSVTHWLQLDRTLRPLRGVHLSSKPQPGEVITLWAAHQAPTGLFAVADRRIAEGPPEVVIFRSGSLSLDPVEVLATLRRSSRWESFFLSLWPVFATAGGDVFALRVDRQGSLFQLTPAPKPLRAFPPGLEKLPVLPPSKGPDNQVIWSKVLARSKAVAGIYGGEKNLFVLHHERRRDSPETTLWILTEIDPRKDRLVRQRVLPTTAAKLILAPGKEFWLALEQGPMTDLGQQATESLLWIPTAWIEGPASPLPSLESWSGPATAQALEDHCLAAP